jgi:site-specific DNA-cytosine methylase
MRFYLGTHRASWLARTDVPLQGFPDNGSWTFCGRTTKTRWSQIGQAMPPALAEAVARAVVQQDATHHITEES